MPQDLGDGQMVDAALQQPLTKAVPKVVGGEALAVLTGELAEFLASLAELFLMFLAGGEQLGPPRIVIAIEPRQGRDGDPGLPELGHPEGKRQPVEAA